MIANIPMKLEEEKTNEKKLKFNTSSLNINDWLTQNSTQSYGMRLPFLQPFPPPPSQFWCKRKTRDYPLRKGGCVFFSSLILALLVGLCTSPPHLHPATNGWLIMPTMVVSDLQIWFSPLKIGVPKNRDVSRRACSQYLSNNTTMHEIPPREVFEKRSFGTSAWLIMPTMAVSDRQTWFSPIKIGFPQNRDVSQWACSKYLSNNTTMYEIPPREFFEKRSFGTCPWLIMPTMAVSDLQTLFSPLKIGVPQNRDVSQRSSSQ